MEPGIDVVVIPHLYDLKPDGTGMLALRGIMGNMIVLSWLYDRAARWTLDRFGIRGKEGLTTIKAADDEEEDDDEADGDAKAEQAEAKERVIDTREVPNRRIYCVDLRVHSTAQPYHRRGETDRPRELDAARRSGRLDRRLAEAGADAAVHSADERHGAGPAGRNQIGSGRAAPPPALDTPHSALRIPHSEEPARRWYPVIDYSRCTNCMECIDFCLFGVYGVDKAETILVEQPDNCRKGCPACSRVCPENAIIFPQHKTPDDRRRADVVAGSLKIDLSKLFGAPDTGESAEQAAIRERDEQLVLAGRARRRRDGRPAEAARGRQQASRRTNWTR